MDLLRNVLKLHMPLESCAGEPGDVGCSCGEEYQPYTWEGFCNHLAGKVADLLIELREERSGPS